MKKYEHLAVSWGPVTTVRLNRLAVRNAMDDVTLRELAHCFDSVARFKGVRVVVVSGEGSDFCAGADIQWMRRAGKLGPAQGRKDARLLFSMCRAVDECPAPVVVKAQGAIYGGGLGLVSVCDVAVVEENAKMCFSECRLGILPAVVSCYVLPKIGLSAARRYYLTSEVFGMAEARRIGLVHEVVPAADLDAAVETLVKSILRNGPNAVRQAKALLRRLPGQKLEARAKIAVDTLVRARSSAEGQEGLGAFLEKRAPSWIVGS